MIVAAHQPDLLPYTGFWHKMAMADLFDLAIWDQYQKNGYQRRVKMRGEWSGWPIVGDYYGLSISDVRIDVEAGRDRLWADIVGRYQGARYWKARSEMVENWLEAVQTDLLWQANLSLILSVRSYLEIRTPVCIAPPLQKRGVEGLTEMMQSYPLGTYLSGQGGKAYMTEQEIAENRLSVTWSRHVPPSGDSILSTIFDYASPISAVMAAI